MESNITLWQFLLELLVDEQQYKTIITWTNNEGEFKLINAEEVAKLWGLRKNKHNMNYDKLSRALRYYYDKHIIKKVQGQKFVYRFVTNPALSFSPHPHQTSPFAAKPNLLAHAPQSPLLEHAQQAQNSAQGSHLNALYPNHSYTGQLHSPYNNQHHTGAYANHHGNPFSAHHHQLASFHHHQASASASENEPTDLSRKTGSCSSVASSSSASASPTSTSPPTSPSSCDVNNNTIISDLISNHASESLTESTQTVNSTAVSTITSLPSSLASSQGATFTSSASSTSASPPRAHKSKPKPPPISTSVAQQHSQQHLNSTVNKTLQTPNIQFASPFPRFNSSLNLNSPVHNSPLSVNSSHGSNGVSHHRQANGSIDNCGGGQQHQHQHHSSTTPSTPSTAHSLLSNPSLSLWSQFTNPLLSPLMMNHKHQQSVLNKNSNNLNANAALTKSGNIKDSNNNIKSEINNNNTSPFNQSPHAFQFPAPAMAAAAAMSGATGQPLDKCMSTILGSPLLSPLLFGDQSLFSPLKLENPLHL